MELTPIVLKPNQILIEMLPDGSWVGRMIRFEKEVTVREAKPEDCLIRLMTHE